MSNLKELLGITQEIFPEISRLIQIMLTYPVTSCEGEQSFSLLTTFDLEQFYFDPWQVGQPGTEAMYPMRLASISEISVLNLFISSGPRKLVCRRLEEGRFFKFFYFNKNSFIYFQPSYGVLLFLTLKLNQINQDSF